MLETRNSIAESFLEPWNIGTLELWNIFSAELQLSQKFLYFRTLKGTPETFCILHFAFLI
jgi:hypothetical protein